MLGEIVRPPTLATMTADSIQNAIFRGELKYGEPLREVDLTKTLNVSRSTIREALHILHSNGLVDMQPHRGAFVTELTPRLVAEVYSLRILLEPYAVRISSENGRYDSDVLKNLELLMERMREAEAIGNVFENSKADIEFHHKICEPSNHELLMRMLSTIQLIARLCILNLNLYDSRLHPQDLHHNKILMAIKKGDPATAEAEVREHLVDSRDVLMERIEQQKPEFF